ncbi:polysaccharide pyruvyl transferase family protein [Prevotella sp. SGI.027]|nr:polysaccharide pyruvyl transferase family protein [Prevotella sp.]
MTILLKVWIQIRYCYLYVFKNAIILNGYVDGSTWRGIRHRNWGDDLNYYLLQLITNRPVIIYQYFWLAKKLRLKNYLCIGTLLDTKNYSNSHTIVWGSGCSAIHPEIHIEKPDRICSVRGKKTRQLLLEKKISCPENYGDPALLLPYFYQPRSQQKKYKLGIIPHIIDKNHVFVENLRKHHPDVLIIDLGNYQKWTNVVDQICSCDQIASSSLHGLIVSDAYNVPNCWIELGGQRSLMAGYFKFYDYASSVNRSFDYPLTVNKDTSLETIFKEVSKWRKPQINIESVLQACPFSHR